MLSTIHFQGFQVLMTTCACACLGLHQMILFDAPLRLNWQGYRHCWSVTIILMTCGVLPVYCVYVCVCLGLHVFPSSWCRLCELRQPRVLPGRHPVDERLPDRHEASQGAAEAGQEWQQALLAPGQCMHACVCVYVFVCALCVRTHLVCFTIGHPQRETRDHFGGGITNHFVLKSFVWYNWCQDDISS